MAVGRHDSGWAWQWAGMAAGVGLIVGEVRQYGRLVVPGEAWRRGEAVAGRTTRRVREGLGIRLCVCMYE